MRRTQPPDEPRGQDRRSDGPIVFHRAAVRPLEEEAKRLEILEVGPYPPPLGGVSVHISRLVDSLRGAGVNVGVANHFGKSGEAPVSGDSPVVANLGRNPIRYLLTIRRLRCQLLHHHYSRLSTLVGNALALPATGCSGSVVTLHSGRTTMGLSNPETLVARLRFRLTYWALKRFDIVIVVSQRMKEHLEQAMPTLSVVAAPAYLRPTRSELAQPLGETVREFIGDSGRLIVISSYGLPFTQERTGDDYGLDTAVEALIAVAKDVPEARLALFTGLALDDQRSRDHLKELRQRLSEAGIADRFAVFTGEPLIPALVRAEVLIRPSRTDGDAVSIREALSLGLPVIASDCAARPEGVGVVPTGNPGALAEALLRVLRRADERRDWAVSRDDALAAVMAVYGKIATGDLQAKISRIAA